MSETQGQAPRRRSRSRSKGRFTSDTKPIRVWCPGSYDTLHFGHINFLEKVRQEMLARFPKVEIVVGLFSDQDLMAKGQPPVFSLDERYEMLQANKWVDHVVKGVPLELSRKVLKENNCDYAVYSTLDDDSQIFDQDKQKDELLACGLLKMLTMPKHENPDISVSHIINRLLRLEHRDENNNTISGRDWAPKKLTFPNSISCREILRFASGNVPKNNDKIVYIDGSFDVLHPGHLNLLKKARGLGDLLYVGLHSDDTISKYAGSNFPIMQWNERLMALLSCKYVSEVVIDAPVGVDISLIDAFSVNIVVPGLDDYCNWTGNKSSETIHRYEAAKEKNILHVFDFDKRADQTENLLTTVDVLNRVHHNWTDYCCILDKSDSEVDSDLDDEVNLTQNRDDGDVLKFK